jgi:hypothetical protein
MPRSDLGVRVPIVAATKKVAHGLPTTEKNFVGWAFKTKQAGAFIDPTNALLHTIEVGESFVIAIGGSHEVPISATKGNAPVGTAVGDLLWILPADNTISKGAGEAGQLPLGVVEEVDAARGVALVNTNARNAFMKHA